MRAWAPNAYNDEYFDHFYNQAAANADPPAFRTRPPTSAPTGSPPGSTPANRNSRTNSASDPKFRLRSRMGFFDCSSPISAFSCPCGTTVFLYPLAIPLLPSRMATLPPSILSAPKAELHLHLEGSVQPATASALDSSSRRSSSPKTKSAAFTPTKISSAFWRPSSGSPLTFATQKTTH